MPIKKPHDEGQKAASKKSSRRKATPAETGKRDNKGKFTEGNPHAWKPGQSGNPAGRPKHKTLSEAYRDRLSQPCEIDSSMTWAEYISMQQVRAAAGLSRGESMVAAAREIADRVEGKPKQAIALEAKDSARDLLCMLLGVDPEDLPDPEG